jgi:putative CocE/NonD family hydrolase
MRCSCIDRKRSLLSPAGQRVLWTLFVLGFFLLIKVSHAQQATQTGEFTRVEEMIPMRDGVRLQTVIFTPIAAHGDLPILLDRTPYGVPDDDKTLSSKDSPYRPLIADGYIFVFQNLRGRFKSEGTFVMQRAPRDERDPASIDESTDAYDTIDWLVHHVPHNDGKVGIWGISYGGWTTVMALHNPHPALKAASEQASPASMFLGDDFHHNGAFRLSYGLEYSELVEAEKESNFVFKFDCADTYEWYLKLGPLSNVNKQYFHGKIAAWNDFVEHPALDAYWKSQATESWLHETTVPVQNVGGWWDQEDFYGPLKTYELLANSSSKNLDYLVVGPWNHGGWFHGSATHLGDISFGSATGEFFRANVMAPWFRYWLHGEGTLPSSRVLAFETGTNQWKTYPAWPPPDTTPTKLYMSSARRLTFHRPDSDNGGFDTYISDPSNPVPYRPRPISPTYPGPNWSKWLVQDQRFVDHRPDVLTWETEPLEKDIRVAGDIVASFFASTSGTDSDWVVKLIDVQPEDATSVIPAEAGEPARTVDLGGFQLIISDEVFRGRFLHGFDKPAPLPANKVVEYNVDLHTTDHVFQKGHKIMVQIQSTWFPIIDRNPQTFVTNIFAAKESDYKPATQRIYHSAAYPSSIVLPVASIE